jgi:hypothetical protein
LDGLVFRAQFRAGDWSPPARPIRFQSRQRLFAIHGALLSGIAFDLAVAFANNDHR